MMIYQTDLFEENLSQKKKVLNYMLQNGIITDYMARRDFGCSRLGARIYDLKQDGHNIISTMITVQNRYGNPCRVAAYTIAKDN